MITPKELEVIYKTPDISGLSEDQQTKFNFLSTSFMSISRLIIESLPDSPLKDKAVVDLAQTFAVCVRLL